jgi:hypothetical protein
MNKYKKNLKKPQGVIRSRKSKNQTIQWSKEKLQKCSHGSLLSYSIHIIKTRVKSKLSFSLCLILQKWNISRYKSIWRFVEWTTFMAYHRVLKEWRTPLVDHELFHPSEASEWQLWFNAGFYDVYRIWEKRSVWTLLQHVLITKYLVGSSPIGRLKIWIPN